jgi:hypothetical protein
MNPDDRIDIALRDIAQVEAPRDFAGQVHARIETHDSGRRAWWPRMAAAAAAMLMLVAATWWLRETPVSPDTYVARTPAPEIVTRPVGPTPRRDTPGVPHEVARLRHASTAVAPIVRSRPAPGDHDAALAALPLPDAISLTSVAPDALVVVDHVIAPLAPITPLSVREMLGDATQGEL